MRREKRLGLYPYTNYVITKPFYHTNEGRNYVQLLTVDGNGCILDTTTTSYARYLYSVHYKVKLSKILQVDHIDGDRTNDVISNLRVISHKDNCSKYVVDNSIKSTEVMMRCPECDEVFIREKRQTFLSRGGVFSACTRKCAGKFRQKLQMAKKVGKSTSILDTAIDNNIVNINYGCNYKTITPKHIMEDWLMYTLPYEDKKHKEFITCIHCGFKSNVTRGKYCSRKCYNIYQASSIPPLKELQELLNVKSREAVGRHYGVSGNAVKKWLKKYNVL